MSSFEPLLPSLAGKMGFAPLAERGPAAAAPPTAVPGGPFPDLNQKPVEVDTTAEVALRAAEERAALEQAAYARGLQEGRAQAEAEVAQVVQGLGEAIAELTRFRRSMLERYQTELLDLALEVARKVVDRELEQHPEHWIGIIREGVQRAVDRDHIRIRVASPLHAFLRTHLGDLRGELEGVKELELLEDPALPATGCIVETSYGDLDLGIESQIATIRGALGEPA
jgi:flagellar assembly protein FliH